MGDTTPDSMESLQQKIDALEKENALLRQRLMVHEAAQEKGGISENAPLPVEREANKEAVRMVGTPTDTNRITLMEDAMSRINERFELAQMAAGVGIWDWDVNADRIEWTAQMYELLGLDRNKSTASFDAWRRVLHPDDLSNAETKILQALEEKSYLDNEYRIVHPDGQIHWISAQGEGVYDDEGRPLRMLGICMDITKHVHEEELVRQQHEVIENLYDTAPVGLCMLDSELRYVRVNKRLAEINGLAAADHIGRTVRSAVPHLADQIEPLMHQVLSTGVPVHGFEILSETSSQPGEPCSWLASWLPVRDRAGSVVGLNVVIEETTGQKRMQEKLINANKELKNTTKRLEEEIEERALLGELLIRKNEELDEKARALQIINQRFQLILSSLYAGVLVVNNNDQVEFANPAFCDIFSLDESAADLCGLSSQEVIERIRNVYGYPAEAIARIRKIVADGEPVKDEKVSIRGGRTYLRDYIPLLIDGKKYGRLWHHQDITDRIKAEEELREAETRYRTVADYTYDWEYWEKPDGTLYYVSPSCERITGYTSEQFIKNPGLLFEIIVSEDRERWTEHHHIAYRRKQPRELQFRIRIRSGEVRWIEHACLPVTDDRGTFLGLRASNRDITARMGAEELIRQQFEKINEKALELQRSNKELEFFAYTASHDLREPLRKFTVFADRLRTHSARNLDDQGLDFLARMDRAAHRMTQLIDGLLELSRVTTRAASFCKVDLSKVISEVQSDLEVRLQETGAVIAAGPLPVIEADPLNMRQLFQNLISNALKFCEGPPRISIECRPVDQLHEITIRDNGIGFDEKYLDVVFKPFQQLHERGTYEGIGMGLAICQRIISRHQGTITAKSTPSQGSVFIITLPERQGGTGALEHTVDRQMQ